MGIEVAEFERCPKWASGEKNSKDIDALHTINRGIAEELKKFTKDAKSTARYIKRHMDGEEFHHKAVNTAIQGMGQAMQDLLDDKKERDDKKDKRENLRDKVLVVMSVPIMFGIYNFVTDMMAMRQAMGVD